MKYGCIGEKLSHSFSKEIHEAFAPYEYELTELAPDEVGPFLQRKDFSAINVTIPYKETVIPYLDEIDEGARLIGAVNTVVVRDGRLCGYNTDFYGMRALLMHAGISLCARKVAILGSGGTSKTARAVASALGASNILSVSRTPRGEIIDYETLLRDHTDTEIIINTTPLGMYPKPDGCAVDISHFPSLVGVVDAVYNPLRTKLILSARARGIAAEGGLYMLVAQAVRASEIFLDTSFPPDTVDKVYATIRARKEGIALVGMPSCGKSTLCEMLSQMLSRRMLDTDTLLEERVKMTCRAYIDTCGEAAFREVESEIVREISDLGGLVIATGGGVVLRSENVNNLLHNNRIYFIDRPLSELTPTASRPLTSDREALERRYGERHLYYLDAADCVISGSHTPEQFCRMILEDFRK